MYQEHSIILITMKIIAIQYDTRIHQWILEKASRPSDKKPSPTNSSPSIHLHNPNSSPNMTNIQNLSSIPLFTTDGIVSMTLNSIDSYPRIKRESLTSEERQRRKDNNLCLYYIDPTHRTFEYTHASKKSLLNWFLNEIQYFLDLIISLTTSMIITTNENTREWSQNPHWMTFIINLYLALWQC